MPTNLGSIDRIFRLILGLVLLGTPFVSGLVLFDSAAMTAIFVVAGLIMLATSAMKFCPLYRIFGIKTCRI